eukprot:6211854-Pleurochrysis_carterae.AAC.2
MLVSLPRELKTLRQATLNLCVLLGYSQDSSTTVLCETARAERQVSHATLVLVELHAIACVAG